MSQQLKKQQDTVTLPQQILNLLHDKSQSTHEYINPNFLSELSTLLFDYYRIENEEVDKWIEDMYGA